MASNTDIAKVFADMATGCLEAANKYRMEHEKNGLKGALKMYHRLLADADRNAAKAKKLAPHLYG